MNTEAWPIMAHMPHLKLGHFSLSHIFELEERKQVRLGTKYHAQN